jgi:hypothetical protein
VSTGVDPFSVFLPLYCDGRLRRIMVKMVDIKTVTVSNTCNIFTLDEHFRLVRGLLGVILNLPCFDPFSASSEGSALALAHINME